MNKYNVVLILLLALIKIIEMNRILAITILMICSLTITAQSQVYKLHPVVGDTIDNDEINKYHLFNDYTNDRYESVCK